jgi:hypothetical protein
MVPTYKIIPAIFFQHFFVTLQHMNAMGFKPHLFFTDNTNVCRARNVLAGNVVKAIQEKKADFDICWWIDSDHQFDVSDFMSLLYHYDLEEDIKVLSARYITRDNTAPRVCGFIKKGELKYSAIDPTETGITEVDAFGFGFVIMSPQVLIDMYNVHAEHMFCFRPVGDPKVGNIIGEDLDWCDKAQKIGYKLYFDSDVDIGHFGGIIDVEFLKYKLEKSYGLKYD